MSPVDNDQRRFFQRMAETYDDDERPDTPATVDFLASLANGGRTLELAIGTGRIALPLTERGVAVDGIDISPDMVDRLREKPGGAEIAVTIGDMAEVDVEGPYELVYVVYNSFCNLGTQDAQVRCFESVAARLTETGVFVIESFLPDPEWLRDGQYVHAQHIGADEVWLDITRVDSITQRLDESHVVLSDQGVRLFPVVTRYVWPSELDLMARLAGMRLKQRWAGWSHEPFTTESRDFVSVYGR